MEKAIYLEMKPQTIIKYTPKTFALIKFLFYLKVICVNVWFREMDQEKKRSFVHSPFRAQTNRHLSTKC